MLFFHILGISSSQLPDSIIFQRGRLKPPTRLIHRILMDIYTILIYPGYIYIWLVVWNIFYFSIFLGKAKNSPRIESEHMEIPEQHYKVVAKLPSAEFQKVCRDLKAAAVFFFWVRFWMFGGSALRSSRVKNAMNIFLFPL
jgi:hypothetical protein